MIAILLENLDFNLKNAMTIMREKYKYPYNLIMDDTNRYRIQAGNLEIELQIEFRPFDYLAEAPDEIFCNLTPEQKDKLLSHNAFVLMSYQKGLLSMDLLVKFILSALLDRSVLGFAFILAQRIIMKEVLETVEFESELEPIDLLCLLTGSQITSYETNGFLRKKIKYLIHTHGMEQFNLPNMQVRDLDKKQIDLADEWLYGVALHSLNNEFNLKPGEVLKFDTVELAVISPNDDDFKQHYNSEVVELVKV